MWPWECGRRSGRGSSGCGHRAVICLARVSTANWDGSSILLKGKETEGLVSRLRYPFAVAARACSGTMSQTHSAAVMSTTSQQPTAKQVVHQTTYRSAPKAHGPPEVRFLFEQQEKRLGGALGASVLSHVAFVLLALLIANLLPDRVGEAILPDRINRRHRLAGRARPGGGGGGGNSSRSRRKRLNCREKTRSPSLSVKPPEPTPVKPPKVEEPPPVEPQMNIPAQTMAAAVERVAGRHRLRCRVRQRVDGFRLRHRRRGRSGLRSG